MWQARQWRIAAAADRTAPEPFYPLSRVAARTFAAPQPHRRHKQCGGSPDGPAVACGRRPVRGVRSEEGKSGLEARRAPSPEIRHRHTGQLVIETMPACPSNHPRRRRHRQHTRRKTRFSTPSNREPILGRPVSRRYDVDKRRLRRLRQADQIRKLPVRARHSGPQLSEPRVGRVDVFPFAYISDDFAAALWRLARIGGLE